MNNNFQEVKELDTFEIKIALGLRENYSEKVHDISEVEAECQQFCNDVGFCVTVMPTKFIYTNGNENGCIIGIINYPRFPDTVENLKKIAFNLAGRLVYTFNQYRASVICGDKTYLINNEQYISG